MNRKRVLILGAGPAGLGAAYQLSRRADVHVTVLERNSVVGGNTGSFELAGLFVDHGSHRLHPSCDPVILADIRAMLGDDLLDRPRHGRILLKDRWIHFPLKPLDLAFRLPHDFVMGVARDTMYKIIVRKPPVNIPEDFITVIERGLGKTIGEEFYFPYAKKIWGLDPNSISAIQAQRRISANSAGKIARKVFSVVPGIKSSGSGRFFYPKYGFGQICEAYHQACLHAGVKILLNSSMRMIDLSGSAVTVGFDHSGESDELEVDLVWSTIPITTLVKSIKPLPPEDILTAAGVLDYRAIILIYIVLNQDQFSEYDAHYFPGLDIPFTRLSEPKNYSAAQEPKNRTILCAELPCSPDDPWWFMGDDELGHIVQVALDRAGIPIQSPPLQVVTRRLRQAYPIYRLGYEEYFHQLDIWIGQDGRILTFGRQGLFAHDNTHHALFMAYSAVECFNSDGSFNLGRWKSMRKVFDNHVVED